MALVPTAVQGNNCLWILHAELGKQRNYVQEALHAMYIFTAILYGWNIKIEHLGATSLRTQSGS